MQANERTSAEHIIQSKKAYKYVAQSSFKFFKARNFLKISDNLMKN